MAARDVRVHLSDFFHKIGPSLRSVKGFRAFEQFRAPL